MFPKFHPKLDHWGTEGKSQVDRYTGTPRPSPSSLVYLITDVPIGPIRGSSHHRKVPPVSPFAETVVILMNIHVEVKQLG